MVLVTLKELSGGAHDPLPKGTRLSGHGDESHNELEIQLILELLVGSKLSDITNLGATATSDHVKVATEIYHITNMYVVGWRPKPGP